MKSHSYILPVIILEDQKDHSKAIVHMIEEMAIEEVLEFKINTYSKYPDDFVILELLNKYPGDKLIVIDRNLDMEDPEKDGENLIQSILDINNKRQFYIVFSKISNHTSNVNIPYLNYRYIHKETDDRDMLKSSSLLKLKTIIYENVTRLINPIYEGYCVSYLENLKNITKDNLYQKEYERITPGIKDKISNSIKLIRKLETVLSDFENIGFDANYITVVLTGSYARVESREYSDVEIIVYYKSLIENSHVLNEDSMIKKCTQIWNRLNVELRSHNFEMEGDYEKFTTNHLLHNRHEVSVRGYQPYLNLSSIYEDSYVNDFRGLQLFVESIPLFNSPFLFYIKKKLFFKYFKRKLKTISYLLEEDFFLKMSVNFIHEVFKSDGIKKSELRANFKSLKKIIYRLMSVYGLNISLFYLESNMHGYVFERDDKDQTESEEQILKYKNFFTLLSEPVYIKLLKLSECISISSEIKEKILENISSILRVYDILEEIEKEKIEAEQQKKEDLKTTPPMREISLDYINEITKLPDIMTVVIDLLLNSKDLSSKAKIAMNFTPIFSDFKKNL